MTYPGVLGTHDLMVHDYGPGRQFASAHVEMRGGGRSHGEPRSHRQHRAGFQGRRRIIVTLHYDPIVTDDPAVNDMRNWIDAGR